VSKKMQDEGYKSNDNEEKRNRRNQLIGDEIQHSLPPSLKKSVSVKDLQGKPTNRSDEN
jgi:hypothetical protein